MAVSVLDDLYNNLKKNNNSAQKSTSAAKTNTTPVSTKKTTTVSSNSGKTTTTTSNSLINTIKNFFSGLNQKASASMSSYNPNSGVFTSSAGSTGTPYTGANKSTVVTTNKAYNQPFTTSGTNYTTVPKAVTTVPNAYNEPFTATPQPKNTVNGTLSLSSVLNKASENAKSNISAAKNVVGIAGQFLADASYAANKVKDQNGIASPITGVFKKTGEILNKGSEAVSNLFDKAENYINPQEKRKIDFTFKGKADAEPVYEKIKVDPDYAAKLIDKDGNWINYADQISEINGRLQTTSDPYQRKELNGQLKQLKEYQNDQNRLIWSAQYDYMVKNGASEQDLIAFKKAVNKGDSNLAERAIENLTSTVESFVGTYLKGKEAEYALASYIAGVDYNMSSIPDKIIDNAEELRQLSMQGASGMEKVVYELYDSMANCLYAQFVADQMLGSPNYVENPEMAKVLQRKALNMSDISVFGAKVKENMDKGLSFSTSANNAAFHALKNDVTESIGGEMLANIITGEISEQLLENGLAYGAKAITNNFFAEAFEEGAEAALEPLIDKATLRTGMTTQQYLDQVLTKDTAYQMFMGGLGGGIFGAVGAVSAETNYNSNIQSLADSITIENIKDYNTAETVKNKIDQIISKADSSIASKKAAGIDTSFDEQQSFNAKMLSRAFGKRIGQYRNNHPYMDAIYNPNNNVDPSVFEGATDTILDAIAPDYTEAFERIAQLNAETNEANQKAVNLLQEDLYKEGVSISAADFLNLTDDQVRELELVNNYARLTNKNVAFANMIDKNGQIIDGVYKDGQTVINPQARRGALSTMVHEFTHGTESSKYYGRLKELTEEYYGNNLEEAVRRINENYSTTIQLNDEGAMRELTAITTQDLLGNQDFVDRLVRYDTSLAYRLYEEIRYVNEYNGNIEQDIEQNFLRAFADREVGIDGNDNLQLSVGLGTMKENSEILTPYTEEDVEKIHRAKNRLVVDVDITLDDFIQMSMNKTNNQTDYVLRLGVLPEDFISRVNDDTGINIGKKSLSLPVSGVRHAMEHSEEGKLHKGEIPVTRSDFHTLADIITNYDQVTYKEELDKKNHIIKKLVFDTDTDSNFAYKTVEVVLGNGYELSILDMYKDKKKKFISTANDTNVSPASTSYNDMSPTSINNISNYRLGVNGQYIVTDQDGENVYDQQGLIDKYGEEKANEIINGAAYKPQLSKGLSLKEAMASRLEYYKTINDLAGAAQTLQEKANIISHNYNELLMAAPDPAAREHLTAKINAYMSGYNDSNSYKQDKWLIENMNDPEEVKSKIAEFHRQEADLHNSGVNDIDQKNFIRTNLQWLESRLSRLNELEATNFDRTLVDPRPITAEQQNFVNRLDRIKYKLVNEDLINIYAIGTSGDTEDIGHYTKEKLVEKYGTDIANRIFADASAINQKELFGDDIVKDFSFLKDPEYIKQAAKDAEKWFGTTRDADEVGYIDTNGKWIDFSGRREGASGGYRTVDHREMLGDWRDFITMGNIRMFPEAGGFEMVSEPNQKQIESLRRWLRANSTARDEGSFIGISSDSSNIGRYDVANLEYAAGTDPQKIIDEVLSSFNKPQFSLGVDLNFDTDSDGRVLTDSQVDYFTDSKIVDDQGKLLTVYHGTPYGGFTTFKNDLNFFTANKQYAERYLSPSASTRRGRYDQASNSMVYEGYLNITKPFDLRNPDCFADFVDYVKGGWSYSIHPDTPEAELRRLAEYGLDWTEADNMKDYIDEKGLDYDGLILNEGSDGGYGQDVIDRGDSYVAFNSNQFKNIDNLQPTDDPDIRLSKGATLDDLNDQARKEIRNLDLASRRVNLKEDINSAIDDIVYNGEVSEASYNALRQDVIRSTMQQMDNPAWEIARDIRRTLGNNFGTLPRDGWDAIIADINDQYNLFDENYRTYNTYEDAQEFIKDYLSRAGEKYIYMSPVDTGDISQQEYEAKIDQKLDQVINMLKEGVANRINQTAIDNTLADALGLKDDNLYYQEMEDLAYQRGQQDLDALMSEDEKFLKAYEEATAGNYSPEALQQLEDDMVSGITIDQAKEETSVLKEVKKDTSKPLKSWKDKGIWYQLRQKIFDKGIAIRDLKNSKLSASYDMLLNAENRANYTILEGGYDKDGHKVVDSLTDISKMIPEDQKNDFDYYMYHKHNIDAAKINKPVFFNFDAAKSQQIVNQYEMAHPEWKDVAQKYYDFNNYLLKRQIDAGVISQQTADLWKQIYPHYVPTKRALGEVDDGSVIETADPQVQSANKGTLYERTGGNSPIQPLDYAMAEHAKQIYKSSLFNNFARDYVEVSHAAATLFNEDHSFDEGIIEGKEEQVTKADEYTPATLIWYDNGDRMIVEIPQQIYDAIGPTQTPFNLPSQVPFLSWASSMRRNMITGANPVFWATNGLKDLQDIAFNSKYSLSTYMNLPRAYKQLLTNGEIANLYKSLGGDYNSYRSEDGIDQNEHSAFYNATIGKIVKLNDLIETAPRLAEFMSSLDHGDSLETAMYNAAEVTTNFKRGGDYAKWLNRNGATFLNASIQGFDKQVRNIADAYDSKGWKGVAGYMAKANLLAGIPLIVINGLLHRDDKDYDQLSDYVKDNYYILWKYDDGKFVRIPKGRIANAYQGILTALYENGVELVGDDKAIDKAKTIWENTLESLKNVWEQVGINDVGGNNIFSPIMQTIKNEAWYGDPIVNTYMQKKDPADQYDESTDLFSVWLGQKTNLSPKKINYLIDQYSGGVGDVVLPMLTPKAETGFDNGTVVGKLTSAIASPFADKFTTDSVFKNQDVTDFFALDEELTKLANKEHASDEAKLASKYINSLQYQMNDLYAQKREIYNDNSIPDSLKYEKAREVQRQIDALARFGLDTYDQIDMDGYYADLNGVSYYRNTKGEWSKVDQDKEAELDALNLTTKEKSDYFYVKNNISELREQVKADTPDGQDADYRAVTLDAIMNSDLTPRVQNLMYDSYYSGKITDNINGMDLTDEEKLTLKMANATASSVKDANGKTISNSKALGIADAYADAGLLDDVFSYIAANGLAPSDFGLTKTVYGYSYDKMASEYQKIYGEVFGTGSTQNVDLSVINNTTSNSSSKKKTSYSKKRSGSSRSSRSSSSSKAQKAAEKARKKQIKALQKAAKALRKSNNNIFDLLYKMTSIKDTEANVKKIMQNAYKG